MKKILFLMAVLFFAGLTQNAFSADYTIKVTADGDYQQKHEDRGSVSDDWSENNDPNDVGYLYRNNGAIVYYSNTIMNLSLPTFAAGETIDKASFHFNLLAKAIDAYGAADLYHGKDHLLNINSQEFGWIITDVSSYLKADQTAGISNLQFSMQNAGANTEGKGFAASGVMFSSGADSNFAPYLRLTTLSGPTTVTPEPVSMVLFGLGAGVLGLTKIRRQKKS